MTRESEVLTVLFTDLVGSTALLSTLGDDAADELRRKHFSLLREAIGAHRGREVKSLGDALMVAFSSAREAVACAAAMQMAVSTHPDDLELRVGIDAGEPINEQGDLFGTPVVVARRLCDAADAGQVLVSELVRMLSGRRLTLPLEELGPLELKSLGEPVVAYAVGWRTAAPRIRALRRAGDRAGPGATRRPAAVAPGACAVRAARSRARAWAEPRGDRRLPVARRRSAFARQLAARAVQRRAPGVRSGQHRGPRDGAPGAAAGHERRRRGRGGRVGGRRGGIGEGRPRRRPHSPRDAPRRSRPGSCSRA